MRIPRPWRPCARVVLLAAAVALPGTDAVAAANNRLGREVVPTFESIRLRLDPSRPDYSGVAHLDVRVTSPTESFKLHALDMDVIQVTLTGAAGAVPVKSEAVPGGQLVVRAEQPIPAGDYELDIDFRNDFDVRANALYRLKSGEDWYCYTQFEPASAREAFPCWDEPEFKIPFQLTVTVPEKCVPISNGPIEKQTTIGGQTTVVFRRTPPMPAYLVALAAGPFDVVPIRGLSVPGRVVTVKGAAALAREAARLTPPILAALEKYFGRPYPYAKLDLLAVPEFSAGAMENPGAVTYRDDILLVDPAAASVDQRFRLASITAHEVAHMWFGNLVTMAWWDDLWLNESFASWMGNKITHQLYPAYHVPVREIEDLQGALQTDARPSTHPIRQPVDAFANLDRLFDELAYQKGAAVLGMLETWIGPESFRGGVMAYLKTYEWGNATADGFWQALSAAAGRDVTPVTRAFLDQGGVPLVSVEVLADGQVRLQQRRFLNAGAPDARPVTWTIPVTLRYSDGRQVRTQGVLLDAPERTVRLEGASAPAWVHPNADERGYYRWQVPDTMLQAIAADAPRALNARERVGLLNNGSALLDAGLLHGDEYLRTLGRFTEDESPEVVGAVIGGLDKMVIPFVTPDLRGAFAITVRKMLRPSLQRFGLTPARGEPEGVTLVRPRLLAMLGVHGREKAVLDWARLAARRYLAHPDSVDASIAGTALNLAARDGDLELYEAYRMRFQTARIPFERQRFLAALGHFRNPELAEKALDYALTGPLRPQEIFTIPANLNENEETQERIWRWFRRAYARIIRRIPIAYLPSLPTFAECCQTLRIEEAQVFFGFAETNLPGTREELAKVVDRIKDCVGLRERESAAVARYLVQFAQARSGPDRAPDR